MTEKPTENAVLEKLQGLKDLFKFGGEILPFVEELFIFLNDVLPLMERVTNSLQETTTNMPKAQARIAEASETAEAATQKIMDKLDIINQNLTELSAKIQNKSDDREMQELVSSVQADAFEIVYSLQFQDITAQQLGHAQQILHAIFERFNRLFSAINSLNIDENLKHMLFGNLRRTNDFSDDRNIEKVSEDLIRNEGISQDDIDKLFQNG